MKAKQETAAPTVINGASLNNLFLKELADKQDMDNGELLCHLECLADTSALLCIFSSMVPEEDIKSEASKMVVELSYLRKFLKLMLK